MVQVKIKKLDERAIIPQYQSEGAACFDLHAIEDGLVHVNGTFRTGLAMEIPEGYVMLVFSRSGHGFSKDIRLANCVGVIDSDYRGEIKVKLTNDNFRPYIRTMDVQVGDRIAQGMILPIPKVEFVEGDLSDTKRGSGGFGSTGQ